MMKKSQKKTVIASLICASLLLAGCSLLPQSRTIPSNKIPHKIAEEITITIYARGPDGQFTKEIIRAPAGWWLVPDELVE